ncbi:MAG: hypothetical protein HC897_06590 [Thermoanaerobaculia bacterium]|nr:hypothetical protein [Thermoanaerobaculia bacterium]
MGRHLIEIGLSPGPRFGPILEAVFEAQLDGELDTLEQGLELARRLAGCSPDRAEAPSRL